MNRSPEELNKLIDKETDLIQTLEKTYPKENTTNTSWIIHHTKVRDAYWRRRMLQTEFECGDINKTATVW